MLPGHGKLSLGPMSVNDVCVMVPAWRPGKQPIADPTDFPKATYVAMGRLTPMAIPCLGMNEHPFATYVDVHRGYRVLTHSRIDMHAFLATETVHAYRCIGIYIYVCIYLYMHIYSVHVCTC